MQKAKQAAAEEEKAKQRKAQLGDKLQEASSSSTTVVSKEEKKKYAHALRMNPEGTQNTDDFSLSIEFDQVPASRTGDDLVHY